METSYKSNTFTDVFSHVGACAGTKSIQQILTFDDGTGKIYQLTLSKSLTWEEYTIQPGFYTDPEKPSIVEETSIIPTINDIYNVQSDVDSLSYSYNGKTIENLQKNEIFKDILTKPKEEDITQYVKYFTGWEVKTAQLTKTIAKTNMPPVVCNTVESSCYTVPQHLFTSCSVDPENSDPSSLTVKWSLYIDRNSTVSYVLDPITMKNLRSVVYDPANPNWELLKEHTGFTLYWVYSQEGRYKITEEATDIDGSSSSKDRFENIEFLECETIATPEEGALKGFGEINVNQSRWQLIAIPLEFSYWDKDIHRFRRGTGVSTFYNCVVLQLEDRYNRKAKDLFKIANAYIGTVNKFFNYVPGFTRESSVHNFPLIFNDNGADSGLFNNAKEIVGFWIKSNDIPFTIKWEIV